VQDESLRTTAKDLLVAYRLPITAIVLFGGIYGFLTLQPWAVVPSWVFVAMHWMALGAIPAVVVGRLILSQFDFTQHNWLLVLHLDDGRDPEMWDFGNAAWRDLRVTKGSMYGTEGLRTAVEYDVESHSAEGVFIEDLDDLQLLRYRAALRDARGKLTSEALDSIGAEAAAKTGMVSASKRNMRSVLRMVLGKMGFEGEEMNDALDEAMQQASRLTIDEELTLDDDIASSESSDRSTLREAREVEASPSPAGDSEGGSDE
jgi:hypothetical protein